MPRRSARLRSVIDVMDEVGIEEYVSRRCSRTAEFAIRTRGPRVVNEEAIREIFRETERGEFARDWMQEWSLGMPMLHRLRRTAADSQMEQTGQTSGGKSLGSSVSFELLTTELARQRDRSREASRVLGSRPHAIPYAHLMPTALPSDIADDRRHTARSALGRTARRFPDLARRLAIMSIDEATACGCEMRIDAAGNVHMRPVSIDPNEPVWLSGSHVDSVPHGGDYDGVLGVVAPARSAARRARGRRKKSAAGTGDLCRRGRNHLRPRHARQPGLGRHARASINLAQVPQCSRRELSSKLASHVRRRRQTKSPPIASALPIISA